MRVDVPFSKSDVELIAITNLRDGSSIVRATFTRKLTPSISAYIIDTEFVGARGIELSYMQVRRVTTVGARVYFLDRRAYERDRQARVC